MTTTGEWHEAFLRGCLPYAVLTVMAEGPSHGYRVLERVQERSLGLHKPGTIYPILRRLADKGELLAAWDVSSPGPARRVYELTPQGWASLANGRRAWEQLSAALNWKESGS